MKKPFYYAIVIIVLLSLFEIVPIQSVQAGNEQVVMNANDSGTGSLRQAIGAASNGDIITFNPSLSGQTIHLASELVVDKSIIINGSNLSTPITISGDTDSDGDGDAQLMSITPLATVSINDVNFTKGYTSAQLKSGGINNLGSLTITNGLFALNIGNQGGAIRNSGKLTINLVNFTSNSAPEGGAILNDLSAIAAVSNSIFNKNSSDGQYGSGGAIGNIGDLIISNCEFSENTAALGGGAIVNALGGAMTISGSSFSSNTAVTDNGGAIYNTDSELIISETVFHSNTTSLSGGAIYNSSNNNSGNNSNINIANSSFISNKASGEGGGAIFNAPNTTANIEYSIFSQNIADGFRGSGGAIVNSGTLELTSSEFSENTATIGGSAIVNFAIYNRTSATATISNTTIAQNISTNDGAIINLVSSTLTLINSTISNNTGGGLHIYGGTVNLQNSILANNTIQPDCYKYDGNVNTNLNTLIENNAIGTNSCGTPLLTSDPNLGPLVNNGGPTKTMALLSGSPAIDTGDDATCVAPPVNNMAQNGINRPQGSHCDIGAYEYQGIEPFVSTITRASPSPTSTSSVDFTVTFSEPVTGVDVDGSDFQLFTSGVTNASITGASGTGRTYTVSVNTGSGNGTIRLDVPVTATITDLASNPVSGLPYADGEVYTIAKIISSTFGDVPSNHPYLTDIEILYANGLTAGCSSSPLLFCPDTTMDRAQSSVFMLRGNLGVGYVPPNPPFGSTFGDNWGPGPWAQKWAQGMLQQGLTAGCSSSPLLYCPWEAMPRLQAAVFGMRLMNGNAYVPPPATGTVFADLTDTSLWYTKWAEQAYLNGLLPDCGSSGGKPLFCPNDLVSRGLGAYMIVRAKNLSMPQK